MAYSVEFPGQASLKRGRICDQHDVSLSASLLFCIYTKF